MKVHLCDIILMPEGFAAASKPLVKSQNEGALGNVCAHKSLHTGEVHTHGVQRQHVTFQAIYKQWERSWEQYMDALGD